MQTGLSRISCLLGIQYLLCIGIQSPIHADVLLPHAKRSLEHRAEKKAERAEKKKFKDDIKKSIEDLKALPHKAVYDEVKAVVLRVRDSINAYNHRYGHDYLTREKFRQDFHRMQIVNRAENKEWDMSRHAMRRWRRQIVDIMFPESAKPKKQKFFFDMMTDQEMNELHDKYCLGAGPALARDLGWCAGGVALVFSPYSGAKVCGLNMVMQGGYGVYCTSVNTVYPYIRDWRQIPASEEDKRYLRQLYEDKHLHREPFYNMSIQ